MENIELLSRYGGEGSEAALDRLGGGAWQARKAKLKKRLLDMASGLIRIAAARHMRGAPRLLPPEGLWGEFAARFPYEETEDQQGAIDAVVDDLGAGRPMDRLVCGDVGFGKTEVALRAGVRGGHERAAGGRRGADDAPGAPALQDVLRSLPRPAAEPQPSLPAGAGQGAEGDEGRADGGERSTSSSAPTRCSAAASPSRASAS